MREGVAAGSTRAIAAELGFAHHVQVLAAEGRQEVQAQQAGDRAAEKGRSP